MARTSYAQSQIPLARVDTPLPDHKKVANSYLQHQAEMFHGTITGAGGVGGTLDLPFDPGYIEISNPAGTPRKRELFVGTNVQLDGITGAAGTGLSLANDAAGLPRRVTLAVALAANGEVVQVVAWGFRDVNGSK